MQRGGRFIPNPTGYREVMNGPQMLSHCQSVGDSLAASAARQSGTAYVVDSIRGLNRIHTRVSTPPDWKEWHRESHYHALAIAAGSQGGSFSTSSLSKALKRVSGSTDRGWKAIAGNRLAYSVKRAGRKR